MIKEIVKDALFLSRPSSLAIKEDLWMVQDLKDTLQAHHDHCVGMAANMIGYLKQMIIVNDDENILVMINPEIIKMTGPSYQIEEGCLCHIGVKKVQRYEKIKVKYLDEEWKIKIKTFQGFTAQIIQHEMDHCKGILI